MDDYTYQHTIAEQQIKNPNKKACGSPQWMLSDTPPEKQNVSFF